MVVIVVLVTVERFQLFARFLVVPEVGHAILFVHVGPFSFIGGRLNRLLLCAGAISNPPTTTIKTRNWYKFGGWIPIGSNRFHGVALRCELQRNDLTIVFYLVLSCFNDGRHRSGRKRHSQRNLVSLDSVESNIIPAAIRVAAGIKWNSHFILPCCGWADGRGKKGEGAALIGARVTSNAGNIHSYVALAEMVDCAKEIRSWRSTVKSWKRQYHTRRPSAFCSEPAASSIW